MPNRTQLRRHADLVDRMAEARGLDLEEEILRGHLSIPDLDDAVLRCTGCSNPDGCAAWLAAREATAGVAEATPGYCRNAETFGELRRRPA